jgi:hypothetical protein
MNTRWPLQARERHSHDLTFRPEVFFLGQTEGVGIDRDAFGRTLRRCTIRTEGAMRPAISAICVDEVMTYDDGEIQNWHWVLSPASNGRYVVAEAQAGSGHVAQLRPDGDFLISFSRTRGWLSERHATRYAMVSREVAVEQTEVTYFGMRRLSFTAFRRRLGRPGGQ